MNIATALTLASEKLHTAGVANSRREATSLLAFVLQQDPVYLIAHSEEQLAANQKMIYDACVKRRTNHEPLQYIVGRTEFWGLEFEVTRDVLIPRPETEILVEAAIETLSELEKPRFCEIGVGSGCVAVSILHSLKNATAVATDLSKAALKVAVRNAEKHGVHDRLDLIESDLFGNIDGSFDMVVSNPPYIPVDDIEQLQPEVRDFEPRHALSGGQDGLEVVTRIIADSDQFLRSGGVLLLEIGHDQAEKVVHLFDTTVWGKIELIRDLQDIERVVHAEKR